MLQASYPLRVEEARQDWDDMFDETTLPTIVYSALRERTLTRLNWNAVYYETTLWQHPAGRTFMDNYWRLSA